MVATILGQINIQPHTKLGSSQMTVTENMAPVYIMHGSTVVLPGNTGAYLYSVLHACGLIIRSLY